MAKSVHNDVLDGALNILKNNVTKISVCTTEPSNYTEANATNMLAIVTVDSSDFTVADDISGRKVTIGEQADVEVLTTGTAAHIALTNGTDKLYYVTTCTLQALTDGNTVTIPAFKISIADPS